MIYSSFLLSTMRGVGVLQIYHYMYRHVYFSYMKMVGVVDEGVEGLSVGQSCSVGQAVIFRSKSV